MGRLTKAFRFLSLLGLAGLVPTLASAQKTIGNTRVLGVGASTSTGSGYDRRNFRICLLPDMQNVVSQTSSEMLDMYPPAIKHNCSIDPSSGCVEPYCTKSPYCSIDWYHTGEIMMQNLAYDLTGQQNKMNWTEIRGTDNVKSFPANQLDHGPCDLILSLGDMTDVPNDTGYGNNIDNSAATLNTLGYTYSYRTNLAFWNIIKASGIPYLPEQGNHDPWVYLSNLMAALNFEGESFYYDRETTYNTSYAILVPTPMGHPLCVIALGFSDTNYDAVAQPNRGSDVQTWAVGDVGCGNDYPTILYVHDGINYTSLTTTATTNIVTNIIGQGAVPGVAGTSEIFMSVGGHWVTPASSNFTTMTGKFGADTDASVFLRFINQQELYRHGTSAAPYGNSTPDSNGAWYTIIDIMPERSLLCYHDWSPYWQTTNGGTANGQTANQTNSQGCVAFDYDTRYP